MPVFLCSKFPACFLAAFMWAIVLSVPGIAQEALDLPSAASETDEKGAVAVVDQPPDAAIRDRITSVLSKIEDFSGVTVSVEAGVVTLQGEPLRVKAQEKLTDLVSRFEGVVYVNNQIEDEVTVGNRVTPVLKKMQKYGVELQRRIPVIILSLTLLLVVWFAAKLFAKLEAPWRWLGMKPLVRDLIQRLGATLIVTAGLILALDLLDATTWAGALLGIAGVAGLAVGFAFRDIVENYIAGILLSIRHPFSVGDHLKLDDFEGKVVRLTSRELVLITLDGNHLTIPNSTVFKAVVCNYTRNPRRRFDFTIGVGVNEDLAIVRHTGIELLQSVPGVIADPRPTAIIEELGESSVIIRFFGWIDQREADFLKVRSEAVRMVKEGIDAAGIEMPEPIHRIVLRRSRPKTEKSASQEPHEPMKEASTEQADVSVDREIDNQIENELEKSGESNLQ